MASEAPSDSVTAAHRAKPRRHFLQFGLRSLLVFCAAFAVVLSWIGNRAADYRRQSQAKVRIEEAGGAVEAKLAWPRCVASVVGADAWQEVTAVTLEPASFATIDGMHGYQLPLVNAQTLRALSACRKLERLRIDSAALSGESISRIADLSSLKSLLLQRVNVTDVAAERISKLQRLKSLDLSGNPIGDAALEHLAALKSLDSLELRGTNVTAAGAERLQRALPKCRIEFTVVDDPLGPAP